MKVRTFQILVIFSIILFSIHINDVFAQEPVNATILENGKYVAVCGPGTIMGENGQCLVACGEGTTINDKGTACTAIQAGWADNLGEIEFIAGGIITGVFATAFGIGWTVIQRRNEAKREDLEFIQTYGDQLAEINSKEDELSTKLDCALYAENYLDVLEQIATLFQEKLLRKKVAEYFVNNFRYGMNLWIWYKKMLKKSLNMK